MRSSLYTIYTRSATRAIIVMVYTLACAPK